jgi:hypothetical protein
MVKYESFLKKLAILNYCKKILFGTYSGINALKSLFACEKAVKSKRSCIWLFWKIRNFLKKYIIFS